MKRVILILFVLLVSMCGFAKEPKQPDTYNYKRGTEAITNGNIREGIDYLEKELEQNPKNGYAFAWLALAYNELEEYGSALNSAEKAIKFLPKNDKYFVAWTHNLQGNILLEVGDTTSALSAYSQSIKIEPNNPSWYMDRGILYGDLKQWPETEADFKKIISLSPGLIRGYQMLGAAYYMQEKYEDALSQYQYALKLGERALTYSCIAEVEVKLKKYEDAVTHAIEALKLEEFEKNAMGVLVSCKEDDFVEPVKAQLNVQIMKNPNNVMWYICKVLVEENIKEYEQAILTMKKIKTIDANPYYDDMLSDIYIDMGDYKNALKCTNEAIANDTSNLEYRYQRAAIYECLDSIEQMHADYKYLIEQSPEDVRYYIVRAQAEMINGDYQNAISDLNTALALKPDVDRIRMHRGICYRLNGDNEKAEKDLKRIENSNDAETKMFAKAALGKHDEAIALADSLLKTDTVEKEYKYYKYNAACIYAIVGQKEKAMQLVEDILKDGYVDFRHLRKDYDLVNLHGEKFEQLIQKYEQKAKERIERFKTEHGEETGEIRVVEVPFTAANGVTKVDCTINGLPLNFVFDTGASDVTISQVEANFMFKNGYLNEKDFGGVKSYITADGNISIGTIIVLRQINFGGLELNNVRASVVRSQNAPLLLGQTVLQRLGKIEIDNERRVLKITTKQ